jgi:[acyl-carrier-protein] S-malonyltransferase
MAATALIFPGQGSQEVGMGREVAQAYPGALRLYQEADDILGEALSRLCFFGPPEALDDTVNTQPALYVTCLAILRALEAEGLLPHPAMMAGHSLGQITALTAAGAIDFASGLRLVRERGRLMKVAGQHSPGRMAAVLKMDDSVVEDACRQASREAGAPVQIANYNAPGQVVISGSERAVARCTELLRRQGARRIVPLAVSIAAHSPLMAGVVEEYRAAVDATPLNAPDLPVIGNISARPLHDAAQIRDELAGQLTWPVRWTASVQWMAAQGVSRFVEVGPKDVLAKLVSRIDPGVEATSIGTMAAVTALEGQVHAGQASAGPRDEHPATPGEGGC